MSTLKRRGFRITSQMTEATAGQLNDYLDAVQLGVNQSVDKSKTYDAVTPPAANTEFRVVHNLGFIPDNYLVTSINKAAHIYRSSKAWNKEAIFLKCDQVSTEVTILIW